MPENKPHVEVAADLLLGNVPDHAMPYQAWLQWTGLDDSFVGSPDDGIPGTQDIYAAAMKAVRDAGNAADGQYLDMDEDLQQGVCGVDAPGTAEDGPAVAVSADQLLGNIPDYEMEYEEWLDWTGLDDSFAGSPEDGIPGTYDIYEAAMEAVREAGNAPAP